MVQMLFAALSVVLAMILSKPEQPPPVTTTSTTVVTIICIIKLALGIIAYAIFQYEKS